jgi:hypothetical protein
MIYTTAKVYPVSLEEAKRHLNIIGDADDIEIGVLLAGAVDYVQGIVGRNLTATGVTAVYEASETNVELPDIEYGEAGHCYALDSEEKSTDLEWSLSEDKKVLIVSDISEGTISIVFEYQTSIEISETLKLAILMAIAFFYENRGDESGQKSEPLAAKNLALRERHSAV